MGAVRIRASARGRPIPLTSLKSRCWQPPEKIRDRYLGLAPVPIQAGGEVVGEFQEVESGKRADRPQLAAALASCRTRRAGRQVPCHADGGSRPGRKGSPLYGGRLGRNNCMRVSGRSIFRTASLRDRKALNFQLGRHAMLDIPKSITYEP
jgi:hypothetical protein